MHAGPPSEADQGAGEAVSAQIGALGRAAGEAAVQAGQNEDSELWRRQRKHMFVLSNAGVWHIPPLYACTWPVDGQSCHETMSC